MSGKNKGKRYMVVAHGDKDGVCAAYSKCYAVKENPKRGYTYLNANEVYFSDQVLPLGTMLIVRLEEF